MAYCPDCKKIYKEPEEEAGSHPCPKCGRYPWDDDEGEVEEEEKNEAKRNNNRKISIGLESLNHLL